jgi:hypothetical protein
MLGPKLHEAININFYRFVVLVIVDSGGRPVVTIVLLGEDISILC